MFGVTVMILGLGIQCRQVYNIGIKHDFPFINIRKVSREVFNISRGTLRMLMNDKIMFDGYYCINSKKNTPKIEKMFEQFILQPYHHFITRTRFL